MSKPSIAAKFAGCFHVRAATIVAMAALMIAQPAAAQTPPPGPPPAPAPIPEFAQQTAVPHGEVRAVWYASKTYAEQRRVHIYLPPNYNRGAKYPVLYLIHGGTEDDASWSHEGRVGFILDNLLAAGKIKPMIVVMPNGNGRDTNQNRPGGTDTPEGIAARVTLAAQTRDSFVDDLVTDIIPFVDHHYHALTSRDDRAIAGFSFGGTESLWAGTSHLSEFAWIGVISMGLQVGSNAMAGPIAGSGTGSPDDFVKAKANFFADPAKTNRALRLLWIGVGKNDPIVVDGPKRLSDTLSSRHIRNEYHESDGGHSLENAEVLLRDFAQDLFK